MDGLENSWSIAEARALLQEDAPACDDAPDASADAGIGQGLSEELARIAPDEVDDAADVAPDVVSDGDDPSQSDAYALFAEDTVGLGVDIVEIERMAAILKRSPLFAERTFSQAERDYCESKANPATHYALRFAAKEAVVKALGTGFADGIWVRDIEVVRDKRGKPSAVLSGRAKEIAREQGVLSLSISLSNTHTEAVACALAVTDASVRSTEKRIDPMEELARQFKETRGMLDEL